MCYIVIEDRSERFIMKKVFIALILLLTPVMFVNAKEKTHLDFDWSIKQGSSAQYLFYDETMEVEDGFITQSLNGNAYGVIRKISKDGKRIIWEREVGSSYLIGMIQYKNFYYMVLTDDYYGAALVKVDTNGNSVDILDFESDTTYDSEIYVYEDKIYVITSEYSEAGDWRGATIYKVNPNESHMILEEVTNYEDVPEEKIYEITHNHQDYISENWYNHIPDGLDDLYIGNQYNDNEGNIYLAGDFCKGSTWRGFVAKLDKNKNLLWYKTSEVNTHYYDIDGVSADFIVVVAYEDDVLLGEPRNLDSVKSNLLVYDKDGNLLETHDVAKEMGVGAADISHVLSFSDCLTLQAWAYDENGVLSSYLIKYTPSYEIKTESPHGMVTINHLAKSGEEVELTVTPDLNYMIKDIVVTDLYGNVIPVTNNRFIMPSGNVIVKVSFTPLVNPNTGMNGVLVILVLAVSVVSGFYFIRKLKKS